MTGDFYYVTCENKQKVRFHKISRDEEVQADRDDMRSDMFSTARKQYRQRQQCMRTKDVLLCLPSEFNLARSIRCLLPIRTGRLSKRSYLGIHAGSRLGS